MKRTTPETPENGYIAVHKLSNVSEDRNTEVSRMFYLLINRFSFFSLTACLSVRPAPCKLNTRSINIIIVLDVSRLGMNHAMFHFQHCNVKPLDKSIDFTLEYHLYPVSVEQAFVLVIVCLEPQSTER